MKNALPLIGLLAFVGCSNTGSVSLTARPSTKTAALITGSEASPDGVSLSRVRILLTEAELRGGGGGCHGGGKGGGGMGGGERGGGMMGGAGQGTAPAQGEGVSFCKHHRKHVEQGPFVVTVDAASLTAATSEPVLLADVPAGSYRGAELEVGPLGSPDLSASKGPGPARPAEPLDLASLGAEFDDFKTSGASVILEGTSQGAPFTFTAAFQAEQEFATPITVEAGAEVALGLNVDATTWFVDANGQALDPAVAADHDAIAANIQESLTIEDEHAPRGPRH